jgi:WD40 repeat protein
VLVAAIALFALVERSNSEHQRKLIRARELAANGRSLLTVDPEASVRQSLSAARAFDAAAVPAGQAVEDVLREGLLGLRLRAVLPGAGAVRTATYSPDGSQILVAGKGGARLFDPADAYRVRRLEPLADLNVASFSPDGRLVAAGGTDKMIHVWSARSGAPLHVLRTGGAILSLAFSPDGRMLACGSADGTAHVWSVNDGVSRATFRHPSGARGNDVGRVSFSPEGRRLLTVGGDRFARVFDVARRRKVMTLDNRVLVNAALFSHNGRQIATAGSDPSVRVWNARTGHLRLVFHTLGPETELAFNPDDSLIAGAGNVDTTARVWNLAERTAVAIITLHLSGIKSITFSPGGGALVTTGSDGNAYIVRSDSGFTQGAFLGHRGPVNGAAFSRDGHLLITAGDDGTARIWDADVDPLGGPLPLAVPTKLESHADPINVVAFNPEGGVLLTGGGDGRKGYARLLGADHAVVLSRTDSVSAASFSRDGKLVIAGNDDGTAHVWRTLGGRIVSTLNQGAPVTAARLSPDGQFAVTAGVDGTARLWIARRGTLLHRLRQGAAVNDAHFSPDGRFVVTAGANDAANIWRVSDGQRAAILRGHSDAVVAADFSPDGTRVATASADTTAGIWNVQTGQLEHRLRGHTEALTSLAFSPDGALLATSGEDDVARIWNVESGVEVAVLRIHVSDVNDVAFSFDGRWLATAGPTAVGIWETRRIGAWPGRPLYVVRGPTRPVNDVEFSPSGWRILFGSRDGLVMTYDCKLCGSIKQLDAIGRARLREIVRAKG